ncbi:MAG: pyrroline-5-carboxylate reductase [Pseudomonadota bacterium]
MSTPNNITLIGCGKMGSAMAQGWLSSSLDIQLTIIEPNDIAVEGAHHFKTINNAQSALEKTDIIVLAVKPQIMSDVCAALKPHLKENALILSIAAGQSIATFEGYLGGAQPIIRAMPNTPAAIGKGISAAIANTHASEEQKAIAHKLLESAGKVEWLNDETLMDAVTAVSGSGPAYVFYLIEMLSHAGTKAGLPADMAMSLARQTVIGSAALSEAESQADAATLRKNVTSPGGTTAAALDVLMNGETQEIFDKAIEAAKTRSRELSS